MSHLALQRASMVINSFLSKWLCRLLAPVYFARPLSRVAPGAIVFFPLRQTCLCCGLAGLVAFKTPVAKEGEPDLAPLAKAIHDAVDPSPDDLFSASSYLGGDGAVNRVKALSGNLKHPEAFARIFADPALCARLRELATDLNIAVSRHAQGLEKMMGHLAASEIDIMAQRLETLKDSAWCISREVLGNIEKVAALFSSQSTPDTGAIAVMKQLNSVLNSIDRLEVRGRDSAGVSLMFFMAPDAFTDLENALAAQGHGGAIAARTQGPVLINGGIRIQRSSEASHPPLVSVTITYKVAAEVGCLGDNIAFIRAQVAADPVLQAIVGCDHRYFSIISHTRWASVGAITEANCHPVENLPGKSSGTIHVCLNGDIDNYIELKKDFEAKGIHIPAEITTDTEIIPLCIQHHLAQSGDITEAFRRAVSDFEGSHAICMHTDLAPGRVYLAQKGSGQAIFVGLGHHMFMPTSEVYGFIEETSFFLKLDGENVIEGKTGPTQGQIFVLDQAQAGSLSGIEAMYYDATPIEITDSRVKTTQITTRDIDRQDFPHYFLKEISESPDSVQRTLVNRWRLTGDGQRDVCLDEAAVPLALRHALTENRIRRVFFVGQGTAGVAAAACADILNFYLNDASIQICALKASELSGFRIGEHDNASALADALVVAISQSGTTTDTNRTVDMVRQRGAHTLAIVNRRDSDITFKVDGVIYTSSGRDIEMSVASTKAFYSQIVAGAILGLFIAGLRERRNASFISEEIERLLALPGQMRAILAMKPAIEASARRHATTKTYWAAVGSGPNKASADEIRIKLSELCYKTISSDYIEDKKHIDLSSEPLIIVCAAGSRGNVIGDIIKDTAIFRAHKATPIVIADVGEHGFDPYAADVFHVPHIFSHLSPVVNTLAGHLWGYYAALTINEGSGFFYRFRQDLQNEIQEHARQGRDIYETVLEKSFREKIARFYADFRNRKHTRPFPVALGLNAASDLPLLLKYLSGRLPVTDFELDFGLKGTPRNMLDKLFECLGESINAMARPVDAIKHQAKTVTVGTSRISEKVSGILFDALAAAGYSLAQLTHSNIMVMKHLQEVIARINGSLLYRIEGLNLLGEPTDETTIHVVKKDGMLAGLPSRVETDPSLKGTKRIICRQGNLYIGKGRKDDRSIVIIPILSADPKTPSHNANLLLLNITFHEAIALEAKVKALGGKYEHIVNIVQENSFTWKDDYLERIATDELFGRSAEKVAEFIVGGLRADRAAGALETASARK
jgi:glucosamine--fructose-6-phosphate aminotransferase (isomerizing)